jgi:hypothetical protein
MPDFDVAKFDIERLHGLFRECTPKLLVVTDGSLDGGAGGFGLSRFISTLQATTIHGMTPTVVHRMRDINGVGDAAFDDLDIKTFDVLLMFGFNTTSDALGSPALDRIKRFMQAGGGVFATGDHEDLGTGMSGEIPRVRAMRYWALNETPNVANANRLTTNLPGGDRIYQFDDQGDASPQRLYANYAIGSDYFLVRWPPSNSRVRSPHPLVRMADGSALDVYPDHPHEGECRIPTDLSTTFDIDGTTVDEWPGGPWFGFARPRAVAHTMSAGNGFDVGPTGPKNAVEPRSFVSIAAYDGQVGNVGRVVTDATWHHYVNVNLNGMLVGGMPNGDLARIQRYWSNLAVWLMPARVRRCLLPWLVIKVLRERPIAEEIRIPIEGDPPIDHLRVIGLAIANAIDDETGSTGADVMADILAAVVGTSRPEGFDDNDVDLPTDGPAADIATAVLGRYVVETIRDASRERLEHVEGRFDEQVVALAAPVVEQVLADRKAGIEQDQRALELLARAALR